jgi:alkylated DNA repair dioxygenase AlkB
MGRAGKNRRLWWAKNGYWKKQTNSSNSKEKEDEGENDESHSDSNSNEEEEEDDSEQGASGDGTSSGEKGDSEREEEEDSSGNNDSTLISELERELEVFDSEWKTLCGGAERLYGSGEAWKASTGPIIFKNSKSSSSSSSKLPDEVETGDSTNISLRSRREVAREAETGDATLLKRRREENNEGETVLTLKRKKMEEIDEFQSDLGSAIDVLSELVRYDPPSTVLSQCHSYSWLYQARLRSGTDDNESEQLSIITKRLLTFLCNNVIWSPRNENHQVAWYTQKDPVHSPGRFQVNYEYDGVQHSPIIFPKWIEELRTHMMKAVHLPTDDPPHSCNINLYKNGSAKLGLHSDNEAIFDGTNGSIYIISFSIGESRKFQIAAKNREVIKEVLLPSLSYITMHGEFQKNYLHGIPKEITRSGMRINMTWRWIVEPRFWGKLRRRE